MQITQGRLRERERDVEERGKVRDRERRVSEKQ